MVYHEVQKRKLCLLHSINFLLQERAMDERRMNEVAKSLSGGGHYTTMLCMFTVGNYSVSVAELALSMKGFQLRWHDARLGAAGVDLTHGKLLLNLPVTAGLSGWRGGRHWVALLRVGPPGSDMWLNGDSLFSEPVPFDGEESLRRFLGNVLAADEPGYVFIVSPAENDGLDHGGKAQKEVKGQEEKGAPSTAGGGAAANEEKEAPAGPHPQAAKDSGPAYDGGATRVCCSYKPSQVLPGPGWKD